MTRTRRGAWEILAVAGAAAVLAASVAWLLVTAPEPVRLPASGRSSPTSATAHAAPPPIGPFEWFNVNDANPFVPWEERDRVTAPVPPTADPPGGTDGPGPEPSGPARVLPAIPAGGGDVPRLRGLIRGSGGRDVLRVELPGEPRARLMKPGEKAGRWTFTAIEDGNVALFTDEAGRNYRLVIGAR